MGNQFLRGVAELFYSKHSAESRDYCFVFPNRRSSLFFKRYLAEIATKPLFIPELTTINTLFSNLSGLRTSDRLYVMQVLYDVYVKHSKSEETIDDFFFWGDMLLNDFDDIDKYLVDTQKLFTNLADYQALSSDYDFLTEDQREVIETFWGNLRPSKEKENEKLFISLWESLYPIYAGLKEELRVKGEGYEGMIYRDVAEKLDNSDSVETLLSKYKKVVFVGLNALNECEKRLLDRLKKEGKADFYWDYYGDIIRDPKNKSSFFMDENIKRYPSLYTIKDESAHSIPPPYIEVIGVPSMVGQTRYISKILDDITSNGEGAERIDSLSTAVVLPDERCLMPLINAIPEYINKVNVTMGFPLSDSNVASFISSVSELNKRFKILEEEVYFYYSDLLNLLDHPFIVTILNDEAKKIKEHIIKNNLIFVPSKELRKGRLLEIVFDPKNYNIPDNEDKILTVAHYGEAILMELKEHLNDMDKEFIYYYSTCINRLKNLKLRINIETYYRLLQKVVSTTSVPFEGEPLAGLQIMGPLETRALDFENLIILSVNEGVFPSKNIPSSFIPYNLRKGFSLPTYEYQDSISAYHFYRSIYRAKNVYLIYDTRTEGLTTGEVSRYVKQLKYHHSVPLVEKKVSYELPAKSLSSIEIEKRDEMFDKYTNHSKVFSPSSIDTYLNCSLKFYYQNIADLKEPDSVIDEIESTIFGQLFHRVLEKVYSPYEGKIVNEWDLRGIIKGLENNNDVILEAFKKILSVSEIFGKNKIIEALLKEGVITTLKYDLTRVPFTYNNSEMKLSTPISILDGSKSVTLFGIIDRVDSNGGITRIVDYKTGRVQSSFREIASMFDAGSSSRPYTAFQLFCYLLLAKNKGLITDVSKTNMVVYSLREIFTTTPYEMEVTGEQLDEFKAYMCRTIEEVLDTSKPFKSTENQDICKDCSFKVLCNR